MSTLNTILKDLAEQGCVPSVYRRGKMWRAHVNMAGNCWEDASTPLKAMQGAVRIWKLAGKPIDGAAAEPAPRTLAASLTRSAG